MDRPDLDRMIQQERAKLDDLSAEVREILAKWRAIPEPHYDATVPNEDGVYAAWRERRDLETAAWARAVLAGQQAHFIEWLACKRERYRTYPERERDRAEPQDLSKPRYL